MFTFIEQNKLVDSRGRIVRATITNLPNGNLSFTCAICDGEFLCIENCEAHFNAMHPIASTSTAHTANDTVDQLQQQQSQQKEQKIQKDETKEVKVNVDSVRVNTRRSDGNDSIINLVSEESESDEDTDDLNSPSKKRKVDENDNSDTSTEGEAEEENDVFPCSFCEGKFKMQDLNKHVSEAHYMLFHNCEICGKRYKLKSSLIGHRVSQHKEEYPCICRQCPRPRSFKTPEELYNHRLIHVKRLTGNEIKCPFCQRSFSTVGEKNTHVRQKHEMGEYECNICGHTFKHEANLNDHKDEVHKTRN